VQHGVGAAVDEEHRSDDRRRGGGEQEADRGGHLLRPPGAAELKHLQLAGTKGFDELKSRTLAYLKDNPGSDLVIGEQADYIILSESEPLTRPPLDRLVTDRPLPLFPPGQSSDGRHLWGMRLGWLTSVSGDMKRRMKR